MAWTPRPSLGPGECERLGREPWIYQFEERPEERRRRRREDAPRVDDVDPARRRRPRLDDVNDGGPPPPPPPPPRRGDLGTYEWAYPDGQANSETMFVFDGDLVVVTKTEPSRVYRFDGPLVESAVNVPAYVGTLPTGERLSVAALVRSTSARWPSRATASSTSTRTGATPTTWRR